MAKIQANGRLYTATIGSFPLEYNRRNVEKVVRDLLSVGIDIPNYPQLHDTMFDQFSSDKYVRPLEITMDYLERKKMRESVAGVMACVIGPVTMASHRTKKFFPEIDDVHYEAEKTLEYGWSLIKKGANAMRIDDPHLGLITGKELRLSDRGKIVTNEEDLIMIYNDILTLPRTKALTGIHVCGRIFPRLAEILLKMNFDFLSHEFSQELLDLKPYDRSNLEHSGKLMMAGIVSSSNENVETIKTIEGRIAEAIKKFGYNNLLFSPSCGFKEFKYYKNALKKLDNMCKAVRNVRNRP